MSEIDFSRDQKDRMAAKVKGYFEEEMNQEIGGFEAEFLIDFFAKELGGYYYNQGLQDAQALITTKLEEVSDALYEIEKPVD